MKTRFKIGLLLLVLLAVAFYMFQMPHKGSANRLLAQDNDEKLPLTEDGFIDYLEITNRKLRQNVTVDNNIVVDAVRAFGTARHLPDEIKESFLSLLGNPDIPEEALYQDVQTWARENPDYEVDIENLVEEANLCYGTPWKDDEHPMIADWLESHDSQLDGFVNASRKPYYYHPLCEKDGVVIGALLPYAQMMREMARGLSLRAMNELQKGNVKECLRDLGAIRRLGKSMDQGGTLVENLVGYAMIGIAFKAERNVLDELANGAELSAQEIETYRKVIRETSELNTLANTMRGCESTFMLDCIQRLERGNSADYISAIGISGPDNSWLSRTSSVLSPFTDWEIVAQRCQKFSAQISEALEIEDDQQRRVALQLVEQELESKELQANKATTIAFKLVAGARSRGEFTADILLCMLSPAVMQVDNARLRTVSYEISDLGFALELYRQEHGQFPKNLDALKPSFLKSIPLDRFLGDPISYRSESDGYRIWNVGGNRIDEQIDSDDKLIEWDENEPESYRTTDDTFIDVRIK